MPQIRELLTASVTAIIRYHETKIATHPSTESLTVQQLLAATHEQCLVRKARSSKSCETKSFVKHLTETAV